ncbi:MAG: hypothetical protein K2O82_05600, partial [Alistipes sp.]|nr:hypothetical protein [Alistipes sp.]
PLKTPPEIRRTRRPEKFGKSDRVPFSFGRGWKIPPTCGSRYAHFGVSRAVAVPPAVRYNFEKICFYRFFYTFAKSRRKAQDRPPGGSTIA